MNCSICGFKVAWCVDKGTYWLCGECATERVMEQFLENQALLRVARAAKEVVDTPVGGLCDTGELEEALEELPEGLLD